MKTKNIIQEVYMLKEFSTSNTKRTNILLKVLNIISSILNLPVTTLESIIQLSFFALKFLYQRINMRYVDITMADSGSRS